MSNSQILLSYIGRGSKCALNDDFSSRLIDKLKIISTSASIPKYIRNKFFNQLRKDQFRSLPINSGKRGKRRRQGKGHILSASFRVFCGYIGMIESFLARSVFDPLYLNALLQLILNYVYILESKHQFMEYIPNTPILGNDRIQNYILFHCIYQFL